jgi:hypothetical protein
MWIRDGKKIRIRDGKNPDPGWKIRIRDKHTGSATLTFSVQYLARLPLMTGCCLSISE